MKRLGLLHVNGVDGELVRNMGKVKLQKLCDKTLLVPIAAPGWGFGRLDSPLSQLTEEVFRVDREDRCWSRSHHLP